MIAARKLAGITNTSTYQNTVSSAATYANIIKTNGEDRLLVAVGNVSSFGSNPNQWTKILSGYHYVYYLSNTLETAWADKGSSDFSDAFNVTLTAVSATSGAKLVYTTDGSEPTATNGTQVTSGTSITISETTTLKVGLLTDNAVTGIITRTYNYKEPVKLPKAVCSYKEGEVCAFFEAPDNWTHTIYCWAWTESPADNFTYANSGWPGVACEFLGVADNGNKVYKWVNDTQTTPTKVIFSNNGSPQTDSDGFDFVNGAYYNYDGYVNTVEELTGLFNRVFTKDQRSTVCLPFNIKASEMSSLNGKLYELTGYENGYLIFDQISSATAFQPYIFVANATERSFHPFTNKTIKTGEGEEVTAGDFTFIGSMARQTLISNATNIFYGYSNNEFIQAGTTTGVKISPYRAYFKKLASSQAPLINIRIVDETPTAISTIAAPSQANAVYNIAGQKVASSPAALKKGIYIVAGKKFVVK